MLRRRLITIPGYLIAWLVWVAAAPIWLLALSVAYALRRDRGVGLRSAGMVTAYLTCELVGMVLSGGLWLWKQTFGITTDRWHELHFALEARWGSALLRAATRCFGLRFEIEGDADLSRGPYLLLLRHASTADTLLASSLVSRKHGVRLRYVLKRELLWDPCLDIVGNRIPNVFVDRFSDDSAEEIRRVQGLARDLGPRDGVLIYPEGTRFTEAKRARILDRLHEAGSTKLVDYARSLQFVLPPRIGGTLGLMEASPEADVVICSHTGFEGIESFGDIWSGALIHRRIRVQFRRIPRDEIPREREALAAWLREEWRRVDAWVARQRAA
jgi:1-acyl-sn-glycerol-3-phosphate acyltransferase